MTITIHKTERAEWCYYKAMICLLSPANVCSNNLNAVLRSKALMRKEGQGKT